MTQEAAQAPLTHGWVVGLRPARSTRIQDPGRDLIARAPRERRIGDLAKYPELRWLDSDARIVLYVGYAWLFYRLSGAQGPLWDFCLSTVLLWNISHAIQSISHTAFGGYRRYQSDDHSRNHYLIGLLSLGEWHNNHHYSPSTAKQGHVWWEIDVGYCLMKLMRWMGLVWDLQSLKCPREV